MIARFLFLFALLFATPALAVDFPPLTGRVVDRADMLTAAQEAILTRELAALEGRAGDQLVIVTLQNLSNQPIAAYSRALFDHWGIGQPGRNNGVLIIILPRTGQVRIEVGTGLADVLPDPAAQRIINRDMLPALSRSDWYGAIHEGELSVIRLLAADPVQR
jgi:uncharacterized protein